MQCDFLNFFLVSIILVTDIAAEHLRVIIFFIYYLKADADVIANNTVAVVCLSFHVDGLKKIFKGLMDFSHIF